MDMMMMRQKVSESSIPHCRWSLIRDSKMRSRVAEISNGGPVRAHGVRCRTLVDDSFAVFFISRLVVLPFRVIKMDRKLLVDDYGRGVEVVLFFSRNSTAI
jgi:hypothetical protein